MVVSGVTGLDGDAVRRDKKVKFKELANKRVNKAIKDLRLVSNLANKKNYEYTDEQAKLIVKALKKEVDGVRQSFAASTKSSDFDFYLD